jgi:hypothetical protein
MVLMFLLVHNVCGGLEIIKTDYPHEEVVSGDHRVMFEFHLETIRGSGETETAVKNLIYQGLSIGKSSPANLPVSFPCCPFRRILQENVLPTFPCRISQNPGQTKNYTKNTA